MPERIPPKGETGVSIEVKNAAHGADVIIRLRSLSIEMRRKPKSVMLFAWRALGVELDAQGLDLMQVLIRHPIEPIEREIEGDANG